MTFCGLDFGTSNSAIGTLHNGQIALCPLDGKQSAIPTALFYNNVTHQCTFGHQAIQDYLEGEPGRLMRSIKSLLGTSLMNETTQVKGVNYPFTSVLRDYIAMLKSRAEAWVGHPIENVIQGRPVRFVERDGNHNQHAEDTLRGILTDVGFKNIEFQFEPLAAAQCFVKDMGFIKDMGFVKDTGGAGRKEGIALVVDMGGGTTDFTVLDLSQATQEGELPDTAILANYGIRLGGTNFDKSISLATIMPTLGYGGKLIGPKNLNTPNWIYQTLSTWSEVNFIYASKLKSDVNWVIRNGVNKNHMQRLDQVIDHQYGHKLCHQIEKAKMMLSEKDHSIIDLNYLEKNSEIKVNGTSIPDILKTEIENFNNAVQETLRICHLSTQRIGTICLTGGSTNLEAVKQAITVLFPHALMVEQDKFSSVCKGLAIEAQNKFS